MDRRQFLFSSAVASSVAWLSALVPQALAAESDDAQLRALLDAFFEEDLAERPQFATALGLDSGARAALRSQLNDYSAAGQIRSVERQRQRLARLRGVARAALSREGQVDYDVVEWSATQAVAGGTRFPFGESPWTPYVVSQLTGPYQSVPDFLASTHPVRSVADAEAYLARLDLFATALDDSTTALSDDAARGVLAPDFALDTTVAQIEKLRAPSPEKSSLTTSLVDRAAEANVPGRLEQPGGRVGFQANLSRAGTATRQSCARYALAPRTTLGCGKSRMVMPITPVRWVTRPRPCARRTTYTGTGSIRSRTFRLE